METEIANAMNQIVEVPIALLYGTFLCGMIFYLILDTISGLISALITKLIVKHKERIKELKEKEVKEDHV